MILIDFFAKLNHLNELIQWGGYVVLTIIIFSETGLFLGFFLPGDSLLVTAGLFAAKGDLQIWILLGLLSLAAVIGDTVGFEIGHFSGRTFFDKPHSWIKPEHLRETRAFYDRHGGKAIILARFMPMIRTFAPVIAGIAGMPYSRFVIYNVIGGVAWIWTMVGLGYVLGRSIPNIDKYIHLVIATVILLSITPGIIAYMKKKSPDQK